MDNFNEFRCLLHGRSLPQFAGQFLELIQSHIPSLVFVGVEPFLYDRVEFRSQGFTGFVQEIFSRNFFSGLSFDLDSLIIVKVQICQAFSIELVRDWSIELKHNQIIGFLSKHLCKLYLKGVKSRIFIDLNSWIEYLVFADVILGFELQNLPLNTLEMRS